jgi:hypothetical protein
VISAFLIAAGRGLPCSSRLSTRTRYADGWPVARDPPGSTVSSDRRGLNGTFSQPVSSNGAVRSIGGPPSWGVNVVVISSAGSGQCWGATMNPWSMVSRRSCTASWMPLTAAGSSPEMSSPLSAGRTSIRAGTTTRPRLNSPAWALITNSSPATAPGCGLAARYAVPGSVSIRSPLRRVMESAPTLLAGRHAPAWASATVQVSWPRRRPIQPGGRLVLNDLIRRSSSRNPDRLRDSLTSGNAESEPAWPDGGVRVRPGSNSESPSWQSRPRPASTPRNAVRSCSAPLDHERNSPETGWYPQRRGTTTSGLPWPPVMFRRNELNGTCGSPPDAGSVVEISPVFGSIVMFALNLIQVPSTPLAWMGPIETSSGIGFPGEPGSWGGTGPRNTLPVVVAAGDWKLTSPISEPGGHPGSEWIPCPKAASEQLCSSAARAADSVVPAGSRTVEPWTSAPLAPGTDTPMPSGCGDPAWVSAGMSNGPAHVWSAPWNGTGHPVGVYVLVRVAVVGGSGPSSGSP